MVQPQEQVFATEVRAEFSGDVVGRTELLLAGSYVPSLALLWYL